MSKIEVNTVEPQCGTTLTLGGSGDTVALGSGASQTGFGRTGTVDWITTPKVTGDSPVTAVSGKGYFLNTTAGTITFNLPAGTAGDIVSLADYAATWHTYAVTLNANGTEKIGGLGSLPVVLNTEGQSVTLVYVDAVQGWVNTMDSTSNVRAESFVTATVSGACNAIVTCGNYKTAIFKGPGTFCVSGISANAANNKVDYLVVAGGGGGGGFYYTGAGGAGGMRFFSTAPGCNAPINNSGASPNTEITVTASPYPIAVGGSGAGGTFPGGSVGSTGGASSFDTVTSAGGGGGSFETISATAGGSGGGENGYGPPSPAPGGGAGNTPPTTPSQGNNGGTGIGSPSYTGGGGGGAGAVGSSSDGVGGAGSYIADSFIGPTAPSYGTPGPVSDTRYFAGGAGGGKSQPSPAPGIVAGGAGGGGTGSGNSTTGGAGTINTGGGGGGVGNNSPGPGANGGAGGSGIVMIRYKFQ